MLEFFKDVNEICKLKSIDMSQLDDANPSVLQIFLPIPITVLVTVLAHRGLMSAVQKTITLYPYGFDNSSNTLVENKKGLLCDA